MCGGTLARAQERMQTMEALSRCLEGRTVRWRIGIMTASNRAETRLQEHPSAAVCIKSKQTPSNKNTFLETRFSVYLEAQLIFKAYTKKVKSIIV